MKSKKTKPLSMRTAIQRLSDRVSLIENRHSKAACKRGNEMLQQALALAIVLDPMSANSSVTALFELGDDLDREAGEYLSDEGLGNFVGSKKFRIVYEDVTT